jgi:hypothetical protein
LTQEVVSENLANLENKVKIEVVENAPELQQNQDHQSIPNKRTQA